ncbi:hypothetical protein BFJ63_vAg18062 [Fusarium oxysporum f. sp. narcissi]|uniref:Uncharacterized protein n=1 Tax=Fusarium oxysporum f. sp. narcissi TaxID=451672 RepID=A0A4V1RXR8_FUSOX|nr:hypothetical protein BFJ63_vAg18062 [Fusarium oxysporum f. sp. narcissi]
MANWSWLLLVSPILFQITTARNCIGGFINCDYSDGYKCSVGCSRVFGGCGCSDTRRGATLVNSACGSAFDDRDTHC